MLARIVDLTLRRYRRELEQRRRAAVRLFGVDMADATDDDDGMNPPEPPARSAQVLPLRLERPTPRRETR